MKTSTSPRNSTLSAVRTALVAALLASPGLAHGVNTFWNTGNGSFETGANWSTGNVPTSADNTFLVNATPVTVTSSANQTIGQLALGNQSGAPNDRGNFTLDLGATTITAGTGVTYGIDYTAFVAGGSKALTLSSGTLTTSNMRLGQNNQSGVTADLTISGSSSVFNTLGRGNGAFADFNQIGANGSGRAFLQSGGIWNVTASSTEVGSVATSNSLLRVTGSGSSFNGSSSNTGSLRLMIFAGTSGTGTVEALSGGNIATDILNIGRFSGSNGTVTVSDSGSTLTTKRLYVGGGVNNGGQSGVAGGTGLVTVSNGGNLTVSEELAVYAGGTVNFTGGTLSTTGSTQLSIQGGSVTGSGTIAGSGGVSISIVTGGSLNASGGNLSITNGLTIGQSGGSPVNGTLTGTVNVAGTTWVRTSHTLTTNGILGGAGSVTLDGALAGTGTINKAILSQGNVLSSAGTLTLGSTLTISSSSASQISSGTVAVNGLTSFTSGLRTLTVNGTLGGSGDLVLTNGTINGSGTINKTGGIISGSGTVGGSVTTTLSNGTISGGTFSNSVTVTNSTITGGTYSSTLTAASGSGSIISTGTVVVSGLTTVASGGGLAVNSTLNGAGALSLSGTLSGSGTINKAVTVNSGGTLSPGNSPGNPTYASMVLAAGGNCNWQVLDATGVAGTGFDRITLTGGLDLTGLSTSTKFNINLWSLASIGPDVNGNALNFNNSIDQSWTIINAASINTTGLVAPLADYFNVSVSAANGAGGFSNNLNGGVFGISTSGNNLQLTFTAVPEPSIALLAGLGMMAVFFARKRRLQR